MKSDMILTLNAGSSSIKFALFDAASGEGRRLAHGALDGLDEHPHLLVKDREGKVVVDENWPRDDAGDSHDSAMEAVLRWITAHYGEGRLKAVGHRVVHGGPKYHEPVRVTPDICSDLEALTSFAPLHQPSCVGPIRALLRHRPEMPQVACFDTAFHTTMPPGSRRIAIPAEYESKGVWRYGFHGLSYEHIAHVLRSEEPELARGRVLVAHIGNGASLCAMVDGRSVATTMGFSVLDGLMMGTRCGHLDAGVVLYMMKQEKLSPSDIENVLYHRSGLLGVSGLSSDMRELRAQSGHAGVDAALDLFGARFAEQAGAMIMAMRGIDTLVFTAGVGEHDAAFRADACARLGWLGVIVDQAANDAHQRTISAPKSSVQVRVLAADEEASIFHHVRSVLEGNDANE